MLNCMGLNPASRSHEHAQSVSLFLRTITMRFTALLESSYESTRTLPYLWLDIGSKLWKLIHTTITVCFYVVGFPELVYSVFLSCLQHAKGKFTSSSGTAHSGRRLQLRHLDCNEITSRVRQVRCMTWFLDQKVGTGVPA